MTQAEIGDNYLHTSDLEDVVNEIKEDIALLKGELSELDTSSNEYDDLMAEIEEKEENIKEMEDAIDYGCDLFILEEAFEDYARELADDLFGFDDSKWPANCIDWERAAEELKSDFTRHEIRGYTYYAR